MNEDTEYELLTKKIYQLLLKYDGFDNIEVKHNIKIRGKSGVEHQIDVYWEFSIAGTLHRVAIECKNYNSSITLGVIRGFHSVLQDIGNIYGIMVTKSGFQSGVIDYSKHYGIGLKLLRNPIEDDWDGRLKKIVVDINVIVCQVKHRKINIDEGWFKLNIEKDNRSLPLEISGTDSEIWIVDENGNNYKNFHELEQNLPQNWKTEFDLAYTYEFANHFILVKPIGLLKVKNLSFVYDVLTEKAREVIIDAEKIVDKVLKDILTNEIKFIHKDDTIH